MSTVQDRLAQLSPEKRALLLGKLNQQQNGAPKAAPQRPPITALPRTGEGLPLSFGQQRLWFLNEFEPDSAAYNLGMAMRLQGTLDVAVLAQSLSEIVRRHEILRTTYAGVDGEPVQTVHPAQPVDLPVVDLTAVPAAEREAQAQQAIFADVRRLYDLAQGPISRATLFRLDTTDHILLLGQHHIASDGWSLSVLAQELTALYTAFSQGQPSPLPELPIQYADFAAWQRQFLQGAELDRQLTYWRTQLQGAPAVLALPTDRPRPPVMTFHGTVIERALPRRLADDLRRLTQHEGATLFMTLLTAYQVLLARTTGQTDIVVGSPIAGRTQGVIENMVGFFLNTLVLRTSLHGNPTFRDALHRVRDTAMNAYAHQDLPFEKLVDELQLPRDLSYNPLFQVMFALQNLPKKDVHLPGVVASPVNLQTGTSQVDLGLYLYEVEDGLLCRLEYNTDLFDAATMERLLDQYQTLLEAAAANPQARIATLPLLTAEERRHIVVDWNATATVGADLCVRPVHEQIAAQAARTPDEVAVAFENTRLTYGELDRRANQLAHHLRAQGVGPEVRVGICLERSAEMVVGLLGILKAGGAYVPLDLALPGDRIAYMLADAQVPVLVTQQSLLPGLPAHEARVVCLDTDRATIDALPATPPAAGATLDNLMYTIYTSGSTGRPKGVQIGHHAVANFLESMAREPGMTAADVLVSVTTLSFDIAGLEIYLPLTVGARVVLVSRDVALDGARLIETLAAVGATVLQATPATWRLLLESGWQGNARLKALCGGEALPRELATQLLPRVGSLWNMYGPTETTIWSSVGLVAEPISESAVVLGQPIANTQIYLLDPQMEPAPIGVPGELYIGGDGLARGYLNRPELTAEKYVPDPFRATPGGRLYRTGDLGRFRVDGTIEFLGRIDHQVKLRGFRIELGEIEAVLEQHPQVGKAIVLAREDEPGDKRLVAYLVADGDPAPAIPDLRAFLKAHVPEYMVPAAFVVLDAFPLNNSGKVDRRALPVPDAVRVETEREFVAPRTPTEERIAAVWAEVLRLDRVGIDDNFFDLGGDSFKAVQAVRKVDTSVGVLDLFKHPTVRRLADFMAARAPKQAGMLHELTPPIPAATQQLTLVCIPFAGGSAISYRSLALAMPSTVALYAAELPGHDISRMDEELQELPVEAQLLAEEIRRDLRGPLALYGHCLGGALTVEVARRLEAAGVELEGVFIGGHFPVPRLPGKFFNWVAKAFPMERMTAKRHALDFLRAMGFFTDVFDQREQDFVVRNFLHDARTAEDYYTAVYAEQGISKLRAPIVTIFGTADRATELYQERYKEWSYFAETVEMAVIPQAGHYFQKHQAREVAAIIKEHTAPAPAPAAQPEATTIAAVATPGAANRTNGTRPITASAANPQSAIRNPQSAAPSLKTFFLVAFGQLISLIGTGLTSFALAVWVYQQTQSIAAFALISVFAFIPAILLAPLTGVVADRWDRRKVMIGSDVLAACGTLALVALLATNALQIWHVYIIVSIGAIATAFQQPAWNAAVAQLVPKRYYGRANGFAQLGSAGGTLLAPLLGGALVLIIGLPGIVLIDVTTFLFAVTVTLLVRFPDALFMKQEEPFLRSVVAGWRYITRRHGLVAIIAFTGGLNYLFAVVEVLATPLVLTFGSPALLGTVLAASGAGLLAGGLVMTIWGGTARRTKGIVGSVALIGLSMALIGVQPSAIFPAIGLFGMGLAVAVLNAHWLAIVQAKVGLELQGRVIATTLMLSWSMVPLGYLTAGPLAEGVFEPLMAAGGLLAGPLGAIIGAGPGRGIGLLMIVAGLITVVWAALAYRYRPIRLLEDALPDAIPDAYVVTDKDALQAQADRQLLGQGA